MRPITLIRYFLSRVFNTEDPKPVTFYRPETPTLLSGLVEQLLAKNPDQRLVSATEVILRLDGFVPSRKKIHWRIRQVWAGLLSILLVIAATITIPLFSGRFYGEPVLNPKRVVIVPFENRTGDSSLVHLRDMAAEMVTQGLQETGVVEVVPATETRGIVAQIKQMGTTAGKWLDVRTRETGGRIVVEGAIYRAGDVLQCQVNVSDASESTVVQALPVIEANDSHELVREVRSRVMSALALRLDPRLAQHEGSAFQPPLSEAYQAYLEGIEQLSVDNYDMEAGKRAAARFKQAYELDSIFVHALIAETGQYGICASPYVLIVEPAWQRTCRHRYDSLRTIVNRKWDQLSTYDRLSLKGLQAYVDVDLEKGYRTGKALLKFAPGSRMALRGQIEWCLRTGRWRELVSLGESVVGSEQSIGLGPQGMGMESYHGRSGPDGRVRRNDQRHPSGCQGKPGLGKRRTPGGPFCRHRT